jgi:outer membrane protein OmpA-like peptidoglycan-associated protein
MKIKLQPGGKLIVALFFLIIFYLLLSLTGLLGIFSSKEKRAEIIDSTKTSVRMPDRPVRIGFVIGNLPENIFSANGNYETSPNSIFNKFGLKVILIECKNYSELAELVKAGGDRGGIDIAYCNTTQLVQKSDLFKAADAKCFMLSDIVTEKHFIISKKEMKNIRDLNQKKITMYDLNSSLSAFTALAKKNSFELVKTSFCLSDKEAYEKLTNDEVSAIIIKDKNLLDNLKSNKNYKLLTEIQNQLSNVLLASSSTINDYYAYLKIAAKCCLISSDSLKTKKSFHESSNFADMKSNITYFTKGSNNLTGFETEVNSIIVSLQGFVTAENKISSSDLLYPKIINELSQSKFANSPAVQMQKKDSIKLDKKIVSSKTKEDTPGITKKPKALKPKNTGEQKTKSKTNKHCKHKQKTDELKKNPSPVKTKLQDNSILSNFFMINFEPNSTAIDSIAENKLSSVANDIRKSNAREVILIGHTDSTGEEAYNQILSKKRAEVVMEHLSKNFGIDKNIFKTSGQGSKQPLGKNSDKKWKKLNRRVNITIKNQ